MEVWKDISGYEGKYQISSMGRARNVRTGLILKPIYVRHNYVHYALYRTWEGRPKRFFAHRLVAFAFIPNPNGYKEINHKDRNPSNNSVENLEWCTRQYNSTYDGAVERRRESMKKNGRLKGRKISEEAREKLRHHPNIVGNTNRRRPVYMYSMDGEFIKEFSCFLLASQETGADHSNISACCCGRLKSTKGYRWSYIKTDRLWN